MLRRSRQSGIRTNVVRSEDAPLNEHPLAKNRSKLKNMDGLKKCAVGNRKPSQELTYDQS
jgi:hypothetical protein